MRSYEFQTEMEVERGDESVTATVTVLVIPGERSRRDRCGLRVDPDEPSEAEFLRSDIPLAPAEEREAEELALKDYGCPAGI